MAKRKPKDASAAVLAHLKKKFGDHAAVRLDEGFRGEVVEALPTGIAALDHYVVGCGGLPVGRVIELFAGEGVGKSSLALAMLGGAQTVDATTVLVETENGFSTERARTFKCDPGKLIVAQPDYLEQALGMIEETLDTLDNDLGPALIVWDSLAATPTKAEIENGVSDKATIDARARRMSEAMRILTLKVSNKRACLVIVNQTRSKIGVMFGDPTTTPGGNALKFHASVRLRLLKGGGKPIKDGSEHIGKEFQIKCVKSRFVSPFRTCMTKLMFGTGFDDDWTTLNLAKDFKVVPPRSRDVGLARTQLNACNWDPRVAKVKLNTDENE